MAMQEQRKTHRTKTYLMAHIDHQDLTIECVVRNLSPRGTPSSVRLRLGDSEKRQYQYSVKVQISCGTNSVAATSTGWLGVSSMRSSLLQRIEVVPVVAELVI